MILRSTNITFINNTDCDLVLIHDELIKGKWSLNSFPPSLINSGNIGIWQSENDASRSGTKGIVQYLMRGTQYKLSIKWHNPLLGRNQYENSFPEDFQIKQVGGIGNNAMVAFTIFR